jgi:hypothetical protein
MHPPPVYSVRLVHISIFVPFCSVSKRNMQPSKVYITVDVECAEERLHSGQIRPAIGPEMRVFGRFSNQRRELGIGLIMDELDRYQLKATFFVEVLASYHFGKELLTETCDYIRTRGHDVQLHLHPVLRQPDWATAGLHPVQDNIGRYTTEDQTSLLREGLDLLSEAGVSRSEIVSFRAGNYGSDNRTWDALRTVGLPISSSYNLYYLGGACNVNWSSHEITLFDTTRGVLELPIANFRDRRGHFRHLQIAAVSTKETTSFLSKAQSLGHQHLCIVTHSFEYFHLDSVSKARARPNRINIHRLRSLCRFLAENSDRFRVSTLAELATEKCQERSDGSVTRIPIGSQRDKLMRLAEQGFKRFDSIIGI